MVGWFVCDGKGLMPASGIIPVVSLTLACSLAVDDWKPWEVELKRGTNVCGTVFRCYAETHGIGGQCDKLAGMVLLLGEMVRSFERQSDAIIIEFIYICFIF